MKNVFIENVSGNKGYYGSLFCRECNRCVLLGRLGRLIDGARVGELQIHSYEMIPEPF